MNFESSHHECLLQNGSDDLQRTHGVGKRADGVFIIVDRGDKKIKVFKRELCDVTVLAGPGSSGATDGSETSASFSQPGAVCCEECSSTVYMTDISNGRLKLKIITSALALSVSSWRICGNCMLTAFQLTTDDAGGPDDIIALTQAYYS